MNIKTLIRNWSSNEASYIALKSVVSFFICAAILAGIFFLTGGRTAYAIYDGSESITVLSDEDNIDAILSQAGIDLGDGVDYVSEKNGDSIIVTIVRSYSLTVECGGEKTGYTSDGPTIADALCDAGITLGEGDTVNFALTDSVFDGMDLVVTRADELHPKILAKAENSDESNAYRLMSLDTDNPVSEVDVYNEPSPTEAAKAAEAAETAAEKAIMNDRTKSLDARAAAAKAVSGSTAELEMTSAPLTDESGTAVDCDGNPLSYSKTLNMTATAYTLASSPNDITASGVVPYVGTVAVDLSVLPLGTRVYVTSADGSWVYGYSVVEDTGVHGRIIDLYLDTYDECINFGVRDCVVYVLD
ncbi:MAG: 3D domain-containing protein [Oscillospiraceae bacterium]